MSDGTLGSSGNLGIRERYGLGNMLGGLGSVVSGGGGLCMVSGGLSAVANGDQTCCISL